MTPDERDALFDYHPATEATAPVHEEVRRIFRDAAAYLDGVLPETPEQTIAIRKCQEAMWAANAAVAVHGVGS